MQTIADGNGKEWTGIELAHSHLSVSPEYLGNRVMELYGKLLDAVADEEIEKPDLPFILDYLERGFALLGFSEIAELVRTDFTGSAFLLKELIESRGARQLNTQVANAPAYALLLP